MEATTRPIDQPWRASLEQPLTVTIDATLVAKLIADQFPHWSGLRVTPVVPGGWDNRTFRLGDTLSVRLPSAVGYVAQVEKEQHWLPLLAPHLPLPIPSPIAKGAPSHDYPWPWSVYGWLEGSPATDENVANAEEFAADVAGFLRAVQRIDAKDGPPAGVYDEETREAIVALADSIDATAATAIWEEALTSTWEGSGVWVHGDVTASNVLLRDGRLAAVIDFGCCGVGDPACDLTIAWTFLTGTSRAAFREAIDLDAATWARARGWALWKALITLRGEHGSSRQRRDAERVLHEVMSDAE
jgi:aminoglycoside phosphotransferase (APT) family kinase protein